MRMLAIPGILAFIGSSFEGVSMALLVPTIKGVIARDFFFVKEMPVLGEMLKKVPDAQIGNTKIFAFLIFLILLNVILKNIILYFSRISTLFYVRKFSNNLRKLIFDKYLRFGKVFFDLNSSGHLHQILIGYTNQVAQELKVLETVFIHTCNILVYTIILMVISFKLTVFSFVCLPMFYLGMKLVIGRIKHLSKKYSQSYSEMGKKISNSLSCMPLIKAYANESREREWFEYTSDRVANYEISMDRRLSLVLPVQEVCMLVILLLMVAYTALLFVGEQSGHVAGYLIFFLLLRRSMFSLNIVSNHLTGLARISGPYVEINSILKRNEQFVMKQGENKFDSLKEEIRLEDVSFEYISGNPILKNISFEVKKGEMVALVGASGSGKSTIINLLMRFYDPTSGEVLFDGENVKGFSFQSLRERIALVSQETYLFNASLRVNLVYGVSRSLTEDEIWEALEKAKLSAFVKKLPDRLEAMIGDRGINLSGGEKQRLSIARAILKKPEILLLDEATSALDSTTEAMIQEALDDLIADKTSLVIAHRLSTIQHANRIMVIDDGKIVEEGTLSGLLVKKGMFYQFWEQQRFR